MPFGIGPWELLLVAFVALLIFGPKRLPQMGRSLGRGMREFKEGITSTKEPLELAMTESTPDAAEAPPAAGRPHSTT
jgi:sec-independent protein translocase protein TatA